MRILLTGGSASGKSTFAEELALGFPSPHYYIATMRITDDEALQKVLRHQQMRQGGGFLTLEQPDNLDRVLLAQPGTVLLECLCNLVANEMFDETGRVRDVDEKIRTGLEHLEGQCKHLIVVTNELGSDGFRYPAGTLSYIRLLGRVNRHLADRFEVVAELVAGIPTFLKGRLP